MKTISILKNTVQEYAWGSYTAIAELLGEKSPSAGPQAEFWMGAHPKAPSMVKHDGKWVSLLELIKNNPEDILGMEAAQKFNNTLPYLFKVLAAAKPLSIQAHPDKTQAIKGFEKENRLGIPIDAYNRNYKDDNHKPECICALTHFWALNGFRGVSEILLLMEKICPRYLAEELDDLRNQPDRQGLKNFFTALLTMGPERKKQVIDDALKNARRFSEDDNLFEWIIKLYNEYKADIGIFSPILLNLICLKPGQAMFIQSGALHSYLDGVGIELMANSDNVLRGGLTPKHVDAQELLSVLDFEEKGLNIIASKKRKDFEIIYPTPAEEFVLSVISGNKETACKSPAKRSVEIILCTHGKALISDTDNNIAINLNKGVSVVIPACVKNYTITGKATLYKASVPL
ncbi:MAG: mannose-6-phosphate isomerase, class I [Candidatus Desulfaltia sp.]|nr:mannose-6-phosphate isomerase, class I [Candidatus Desulfaltia sp.]